MYKHKQQNFKMDDIKMIKLKGEIDKFTIIVGYFNFPLSVIDRTIRLSGRI